MTEFADEILYVPADVAGLDELAAIADRVMPEDLCEPRVSNFPGFIALDMHWWDDLRPIIELFSQELGTRPLMAREVEKLFDPRTGEPLT